MMTFRSPRASAVSVPGRGWSTCSTLVANQFILGSTMNSLEPRFIMSMMECPKKSSGLDFRGSLPHLLSPFHQFSDGAKIIASPLFIATGVPSHRFVVQTPQILDNTGFSTGHPNRVISLIILVLRSHALVFAFTIPMATHNLVCLVL